MRFSSTTLILICIAPLTLLCSACKTSEADALKAVEGLGCADVKLTRDDDKSFSYTATCGGEECMGFLSMDGSSSNSTKVCTPKKAPVPVGIGKVILGEGGVTGYCDKATIEGQLKKMIPQFKACYDKDLQTYPNMKGAIPMSWTIGAQGDVIAFDMSGEESAPVMQCLKQSIESAKWVKPEQYTCAVQWVVGLYTEDVLEGLGNDRPPRSEQCQNPINLDAGSGESLVAVGPELDELLKRSWTISSLTLYTSVEKKTMHVKADQFKGVPAAGGGPAEGRSTLVCHMQDLHYTATTTKDKDGKEVKTVSLAGPDSTTSSGNMSLPAVILANTGKVQGNKKIAVTLKNGMFDADLADVFTPEEHTLESTLKEMEKNKAARMSVVKRGPNTMAVSLSYKLGEDMFLFGEGVYTPLDAAP